jgi:predicted nucleic acid-binding protein
VIFIDTSYLVALAIKNDALHDNACAWSKAASGPFVITEYVLLEFINRLSASTLRQRAHTLATSLCTNPAIRIIPSSAELFQQGLRLHADRPDKAWSLTDCTSFIVMESLKSSEALTFDQHFEQAGYVALLRRTPRQDDKR